MSESTYDTDFYTWTQQQAKLLRDHGATLPNVPIDWAHVAEEIEDMGKSQKHALKSHLKVIIRHLLKLEYSPAEEPRLGWKTSVQNARREIEELLEENPGLKGHMDELTIAAWRGGRLAAMDDFEIYGEHVDLPETCPYGGEEIQKRLWFLDKTQ